MPNQLSIEFGVGKPYTTVAQVQTYINGLNLVTNDQNLTVVLHNDFVWSEQIIPVTSDLTHRVTFIRAGAMAEANQASAPVDYGNTGPEFIINLGQYGANFKTGMDIKYMRVRIEGSVVNKQLYFGSGVAGQLNNLWRFCRIKLNAANVSHGAFLNLGLSSNKTYIEDCLITLENAGSSVFLDNAGTSNLRRCTIVGRGPAANNCKLGVATYGGTLLQNLALINIGPEIVATNLTLTNCYSNRTPTVGNITNAIVVAGTNTLVVNDTNDFRPVAAGPLVNTATGAADKTDDLLGNYRGDFADVGCVQLTPQVRPPVANASISSVVVTGRQLVVSGTFNNTATSGIVELKLASAPTGATVASVPMVITGNDFTATFSTYLTPAAYAAPVATMTNESGTGASAGGNVFTINPPAAPTLIITSQTKVGREVTIQGTYTGSEVGHPVATAVASITAAVVPNGAVSKGSVPVTLNPNGTFIVRLSQLSYGEYSNTNIAITNFANTIITATGASVSVVSPALAVGTVLTTIKFENNTNVVKNNEPVTFGQVFKEGHLPILNAAVGLRAPNNTMVDCQLDVKAENTDASVRHGILSAIIPSIPANSSVTYSIVRVATAPVGSPAMPADFAGLNASILLTDTGTDVAGPNAGTLYTADAAARLAAGTYETWLSGPIVSEWIVRVPLMAGEVENLDIGARFSIRAYKGQAKARIDFIVENNWVKPKSVPSGITPWETVSVTDKVYSFALKIGANTVHSRNVNGYLLTKLNYQSSTMFDPNPTGLPNDSTTYNAVITVDGVAKNIAIVGSAAQNYGQLKVQFDAQLAGSATCLLVPNRQSLKFVSATTGANSKVVLTTPGTLFAALGYNTPYRPIFGNEVVHYRSTRWVKTFWMGTAPTVHIAHNKEYLVATGAVPNYKPTLTGSVSEIAARKAELALNDDIGTNGITKAYMGDVGFARGIGIFPEWVAMYFVNQGEDAKNIMLKQADLSGSWPFHVREWDTDKPISFAKWPHATTSSNGGDSTNPLTNLQEKFPNPVASTTIPVDLHIPDSAHAPDFCFLPYLVTGNHFYMEEMLFYQRYLGYHLNPHATYRDGRKCLWFGEQPRGIAWTMRTALHTHYLLPASYSLRNEVEYELNANLTWFMEKYVNPNGQFHNKLGFIHHPPYGMAYPINGVAYSGGSSWMDDFITSACGRAIELGYSDFMPLLQFKSKFSVGRMTSGADFCWQLGAAYPMAISATSNGPVFNTFAEVYQATYSTAIKAAQCGTQAMTTAMTPLEGSRPVLNSMNGYPDLVGGYPSNMQPAIAYAASYDTLGGDDAWAVFDARSLKPDYNLGPQFSIEPRVPVVIPVDPPPGDTAVPVMVGTIEVSNITTNGFLLICSAATDNVGVQAYEYSIDGGATYSVSITNMIAVVDRPPATVHQVRIRAYDAAGNRSLPLSATVTTASVPVTTPVYPLQTQVIAGVNYGPTGANYTGSYVPSVGGGTGATAAEIAAAVWSHEIALSIPQFLAVK